MDRVIKNISGWQMQLECPPLSSSRNTSQYYRYIARIKWYEMIQCFRIAMTRKALQRCVRPSQPALLLDRWHIPPHSKTYLIWLFGVKNFQLSHKSFVTNVHAVKTFVFFVNLCQLEEAMQIKGDDLPHLKAASLSPGKRKSSESGDVAAAPTSSPKVNSPPKSLPEANLGVDMLLARPAALYVRTRLYICKACIYMQRLYPYICKASTHKYAKLHFAFSVSHTTSQQSLYDTIASSVTACISIPSWWSSTDKFNREGVWKNVSFLVNLTEWGRPREITTPQSWPHQFVKMLAHYSWNVSLLCAFSEKVFYESVFSRILWKCIFRYFLKVYFPFEVWL